MRRREPGFAGLAAIVCGQQLSTASAAAIWGRVSAAFDPFHHDAIRKARADRLGRLGLSAAKIKTLKNIARELAAERLNLDVLAEEDADAAHNTLTALHGIGPWTADVYLLFCLGHGDAWPAGDLAVQEAVKIGLGLKTRPTPKQMAPLAEPWRPLRGAAAHLWWAYYRVLKKREGVIGRAHNSGEGSCPNRRTATALGLSVLEVGMRSSKAAAGRGATGLSRYPQRPRAAGTRLSVAIERFERPYRWAPRIGGISSRSFCAIPNGYSVREQGKRRKDGK